MWSELLKDYHMSIFYHPNKANLVEDDLSRMIMGSVSQLEETNKDVVKDVHRLARFGVRLKDSFNGCFVVHNNSESSLVLEVKSKQHFDQPLMELKESVLGKLNESLSLGGMVS